MEEGGDEGGGPGAHTARTARGALQPSGGEGKEEGSGSAWRSLRVSGGYLWGGEPTEARRGKFIHFYIFIFLNKL